MEVKDLRIGNYIFDACNQPTLITSRLMIALIDGAIKLHSPIVLTDALLLKSGFGLYTETNEINIPVDIAKRHPIYLRLLANEWIIFIKEGSGYFKSIKYLHELQNIYFALTGRELEINL